MYNKIEGVCMIFKKLTQKFNKKEIKFADGTTNPLEYSTFKNDFLDNLTQKALSMYEKKCDIKHFTELVLSDPENTSHNDLVNNLIKQGIVDPFEDDKLAHLADNKALLRDLGLIE